MQLDFERLEDIPCRQVRESAACQSHIGLFYVEEILMQHCYVLAIPEAIVPNAHCVSVWPGHRAIQRYSSTILSAATHGNVWMKAPNVPVDQSHTLPQQVVLRVC